MNRINNGAIFCFVLIMMVVVYLINAAIHPQHNLSAPASQGYAR